MSHRTRILGGFSKRSTHTATAQATQVWYRLQSTLAELIEIALAGNLRSAAIWHTEAPMYIDRESSGRASLWWEPYDPTVIPPDFHSFSVHLGQTRFGVLAAAPELVQPDTLLHVELTAQICAYHTSLVELHTVLCCLMAQAGHQRLLTVNTGDSNNGTTEREDIPLPTRAPILTPRERDILMSLCRGETEDECARRLFLAPATVHSHRQRLFHRLDVHAPHEAILLGYALRLVDWVRLVDL